MLGAERVPPGSRSPPRPAWPTWRPTERSPTASRSRWTRRSGSSRSRPARGWATPTTRCWCRCAPARASRCPGCSTPCSTWGSDDEAVRGAGRSHGQRALRLGLLPPLRADVRQRLPRRAGRADRGRDQGSASRRPGSSSTPSFGVDDLKALVDDFKELYRDRTGEEFPQDPREQLSQAIRAVFDSWHGRPRGGVPADQPHPRRLGHRGERAADGVRQQGRQLVLGRGVLARRDHRRARALGRLPASTRRARTWCRACAPRSTSPSWSGDARGPRRADGHPAARSSATTATCRTPSSRSRRGSLYMLQTRNAKRPAQAAVRFAVDAVERGPARRGTGARDDRRRLPRRAAAPTFARDAEYEVIARGVAASPGAAKGAIVFTAADAVGPRGRGPRRGARPALHRGRRRGGLLRRQGHPHLARAARPATRRWWRAAWARRACAGASSLEIDLAAREVRVGDTELTEGDLIAIDGTLGDRDHRRRAAGRTPRWTDKFETVLEWSDELRRLRVRTNADTPEDARKARDFGAEGIGLCRTEHMFMAADRQPKMRAMIMAETEEDRRAALARAAAAPAARTSRACSRRWRGCRSRSACSTRRCTSSSPASRSWRARSSARG